MSEKRKRIIRISTVPLSLSTFCRRFIIEASNQYDFLAVSSPGAELDILKSDNIETAQVPMKRNIAPFADLLSLWRLYHLFRREKPDMVHSITPKAGLLAMIAARLARVPVRVHSFTGLLFPTAKGLKRRILMLTDRITCACATHILPEGQGVKNDLLINGITKKSMQVLGYGNVRGVDLDHYTVNNNIIAEAVELRKKYGIAPSDFVFVFVGRVVADKGIAELARAFVRLQKTHQNVHLLIGGHPEPDEYPLDAETADIIENNPAIHCNGEWITDVRPWYAAADALVFPSYREGFPNVVLEAGAMKLPAIVTDINGSREIVTEGYNGTIVPAQNTDALFGAMKSFVEADNLQLLGQNARERVEQRYEASFVRSCLLEFYNKVL